MRLSSIQRGLNRHLGLVCFCMKGFLVNRYILRQPNKSEKPRVDVVVGVLLGALEKGRFEEKPPLEQEDILTYLYNNWEDLRYDSSVIEALKETNFVTNVDGGLYKPIDLFDPGDALVTSLFHHDQAYKFPGRRFVSDRWLGILRKTGLQNTLNAHTMLQCARRIEFLGAESMKHGEHVDREILALAKILTQTVLEYSSLLHDRNFCSVFGTIACVPAEEGFHAENDEVKRVVCSYSEAILVKDWALAGTAAPVLSNESLVPPDYSWGALQLRSPPPFRLVLKHLQQLEAFTLWPRCFRTLEEATFEVLKYLDKNRCTLSSSDVSKLSKIAFIFIANRGCFVMVKSLVTHLTINLWPISHKLPPCYLPFEPILKELGLHDRLSISSTMMLLSNCRHNLLNPNELRAVIELLNFICDETTELDKSDRSKWESKLVVPDKDCRLVRPNSCIYIDPFGSQYVKYIDSSKLRFVHRDVSERLCLAFGVRKLSDVVVEELECVPETLDEIGYVSLAAIRSKLISRSFQVAVSSVVNNFCIVTSRFKIPDFLTLQRLLESVAERLQFVHSIYTRFWLLPKSLDITRASSLDSIISEWEGEHESRHRSLYYIDRSNTCMLIAKPPSYVQILDLVAIVVSHVLGSPFPLPIGSLFLYSETELTNIRKLPCDEIREMDSGTVFLGRDIIPQDAMQVQLKPLRPFYKGEIVAWRSRMGEKLKYGRITEDVSPSAGQVLYRLGVETSPGKTETIISTHVFWFGNLLVACKSSAYRHTIIKELEHGRVPDVDFVPAVEEMLSVAGISLDTDTEGLLQNTMSLKERLNESQAAVLLEQEKSQIARKEVLMADTALLCRICLTREPDIAIVPCGHVLCYYCPFGLARCPFCRIWLSKIIRLRR